MTNEELEQENANLMCQSIDIQWKNEDLSKDNQIMIEALLRILFTCQAGTGDIPGTIKEMVENTVSQLGQHDLNRIDMEYELVPKGTEEQIDSMREYISKNTPTHSDLLLFALMCITLGLEIGFLFF